MRAKTLPGPVDGRQRFLRGNGSVPARNWLAAIVAVAAVGVVLLSEVSEQHLAAARDCFTVAHQRFGLAPLNAALALVGLARVDQPQQVYEVGGTISHPCIGRQSVAARPPGFLLVCFQGFRGVEMGNKPDIGFVDPHAERNRRHDNYVLLAQKTLLILLARRAVKTGVTRNCDAPAGRKPRGRFLDRLPGETIYDASIARMVGSEKLPELLERVALGDNAVMEIRPIVTGGEDRGVTEPELGDDIALGRSVGGCGKGQ